MGVKYPSGEEEIETTVYFAAASLTLQNGNKIVQNLIPRANSSKFESGPVWDVEIPDAVTGQNRVADVLIPKSKHLSCEFKL